jgi:ABC-2 type transport system permease protein
VIVVLRRLLWEQRVRLPLILGAVTLWGLLVVLIFTTADPRSRDLSVQPGNVAVAARLLGLDPLAAWVSLAQVHPVFLLAAGLFAVGVGIRAIAGELEAGTLELTLARPLGRARHLGAYLLLLLPGCVLIALGYAAGALLGDALFDPPGAGLRVGHMLLAALGSALLLMAIGGVAVLVSSLSLERGRALAWVAGVLILMYAGAFLLPLVPAVAPLARLSVFWYFTPGPAIQRGTVAWGDLAVLALTALVTLAAAAWRFARRDLAP